MILVRTDHPCLRVRRHITFTPMPPSTMILYIGRPSTCPLTNKGLMYCPNFSGFSNDAVFAPSTNSATSFSGALNSVGNTNTMLTPISSPGPWFVSLPSLCSFLANLFFVQVIFGLIIGRARLNHSSRAPSTLFIFVSLLHNFCNIFALCFAQPGRTPLRFRHCLGSFHPGTSFGGFPHYSAMHASRTAAAVANASGSGFISHTLIWVRCPG
jgi:hypothetical protein